MKNTKDISRQLRHLIDQEELTGTPEVNAIARKIYESNYEYLIRKFAKGLQS